MLLTALLPMLCSLLVPSGVNGGSTYITAPLIRSNPVSIDEPRIRQENAIIGYQDMTGGATLVDNEFYQLANNGTKFSVIYDSRLLFEYKYYCHFDLQNVNTNYGVEISFSNTYDSSNLLLQFYFMGYDVVSDAFWLQSQVLDMPFLYDNKSVITIDFNDTISTDNFEFYPVTDFQHFRFTFTIDLLNENAYNVLTGSTYNQGYQTGYNNGKTDGLNEFLDSDFYKNELDDQYQTGYQNGKNAGYNEGIHTQTYTFTQLFGAIADTPILILRNLLGFDVFGVDAMAILMSMLTGAIVLYLIKKIIL